MILNIFKIIIISIFGSIYQSMDYRHWDKWKQGDFSHIFIQNKNTKEEIDILEGLPYHCPQEPLVVQKIIFGAMMGKKFFL